MIASRTCAAAVVALAMVIGAGCDDGSATSRDGAADLAVDAAGPRLDLANCGAPDPLTFYCGQGCCGPCPPLAFTSPAPSCSTTGVRCVYENQTFTCGADGVYHCHQDGPGGCPYAPDGGT